MTIGHLIHVGYPKSASTSLQRWFANHPQMSCAPGGIAGFRDVYAISREAYAPPERVRWRVTSSEDLATPSPRLDDRADFSVLTLEQAAPSQAAAAEMVAELFPNATILLITRGFRALWLAGYSEYVRSGGTADFDTYLVERDRYAVDDYDRVLGYYRDRFGPERVIVMPFELLRDDTEGFLRKLEGRLGIDAAAMPLARLNPSVSAEELYWYPVISRIVLRSPVAGLRRRYLRALLAGRLRWLVKVLSGFRPAGRITGAMITEAHLAGRAGAAETLRSDPLYAAYRADYLLQA